MSKTSLFLMATPGVALFGSALAVSDLPGLNTLILPVIIILFLVLVNGFFVAAEFAIIGVRSTQMEQLAQEGNKEAQKILDILESPQKQDSYIATAQLGITIASLGLGMYGEPQSAHFLEEFIFALTGTVQNPALIHSISTIIALSLLTYLHIVIGEMVPKSISLASPARAVLSIAQPMNFSQKILGIPVRILNGIGRLLLQLFQIAPAEGHARLHSAEEIELIVSESAEVGMLFEEEEEMIRNIFDFGDRQVGQVMSPRPKVQAIPVEMPPDELLTFVTTSRHSRFPVYENDLDHVVGILHLNDLVRRELSHPGDLDIIQLLRPAPAVPEGQLVEHLLAAFKRQRIHMAIVLDEFGGLAGIVTLEDLVEEIVGEVRDEFDFEKEPIIELGPGSLEVAGIFLVDDLKDYVYFGEEEDMPDVETVGGLIHTWLGRPPQVGDVISPEKNEAVRFIVLDVDGLAVSRAKIEFPVGESEEDE